jgi:plasmid stabilization system protein ParE
MTRLRVTDPARRQIVEIHRYIALDDALAADRVVAAIDRSIELLVLNPGLGRRLLGRRVRMVAVRRYPYVIFFQYFRGLDEIRIVSVRHGARRRPALQEDAAEFRAVS